MNYFADIRFYKWLVAILVILNAGTITFTLISHLEHKPFREIKGVIPEDREEMHRKNEIFLRNELNLDDEQMIMFRKSRESHFESIRDLQKKSRLIREELFDSMFIQQPNQVKIDSLVLNLGEIMTEIEKLNSTHFLELRSFCRPDQQEKFGKIFREMVIRQHPGHDRPSKEKHHPGRMPGPERF